MSARDSIREITSLADAIALLDEYMQAYQELSMQNTRLLHQHIKLKRDLEHARAAADYMEVAATWQPKSECPF